MFQMGNGVLLDGSHNIEMLQNHADYPLWILVSKPQQNVACAVQSNSCFKWSVVVTVSELQGGSRQQRVVELLLLILKGTFTPHHPDSNAQRKYFNLSGSLF